MNRYRRFFEVRIEPGGPVHLCDGEARRGGLTLCGQRWHYREPAFDPYANPYYATAPENAMCHDCQAKAHELTVASITGRETE
jgi:hypothetical protein